MLVELAAEGRKRGLVAAEAGRTAEIAPPSAAARLRAASLQALGQFAPLLSGAAMLSCLVLAATLRGRVDPLGLASWFLIVLAAAWLATRRIQANAHAWLRRAPPRRIGIENGAMIGLLAALCTLLPAVSYARQPPELRTVIAGTLCALMCGALAVASAPAAAIVWAATLTFGLGLAVLASGGAYWPAMTLSIALHFVFIALVVRRIGRLSAEQAGRLVADHAEAAAARDLVREYEERGTNCLWQIDASGAVMHATPAFAALFGRPSAQLSSVPLPALISGDARLGAALAARTAFSGIEIEIGEGAARRAVSFSGTPIVDAAGGFAGFRGICTDMTETRSSERRLRELASIDVLTGLPNRQRMRDRLAEALLAARGGRPCTLLMLDLDGFKPINDGFGHPAGDALLKTVAERLSREIGDRGVVGRVGGDEFMVVVHGVQGHADVEAIAGRLIAAVGETVLIDRASLRVGLSVGSACGPIDGDTVDALVKRADLALYEAKAAGRGTHRAFDRAMEAEGEKRLRLEQDLREALARGQFSLRYQPLVRAADHEVTGFEALLRWEHPERGFVPPSDFVPIAEEAGLIEEIGAWVLKTATRDCARWPASISVAVNVSPLQLRAPDLPARVSDALARARLSANRLELEVTESVFLGDGDGQLDVLRRLRALGVRIALDDFGTGYSSLGCLNRTIFNKLKIDGSFVRAAGARPETVPIIQAIVTLANCFGMTITAEAIETQEDFRRMADLGCHQMQGYLFGRPMPLDQATALVRERIAKPLRQAG